MRFIDLKLFLLLFACVGGAVLYESPVRFRTLVETREPWDVSIVGQGYFQVTKEFEKEVYYTRAGRMKVDSNGRLHLDVNGQAWFLEPAITVPGDWNGIQILDDGQVTVLQPGGSSPTHIGQLQITKFQAQPAFEDEFAVNMSLPEKRGIAMECNPGSNGAGILLQGWLEQPAESVTYRYAKPILIGSVIAIVMKVLLDVVIAQQKMQKLLQGKQAGVELE